MTDEPLDILHVFRAPVGGLYRHVLDLSRGQIERGHRVGFIADSTTGGERALQSLAEIEKDFGQHATAARRIAQEFFDSNDVLSRLLSEIAG